MNITYFEGLSGDFSNLEIIYISDDSTGRVDYEIVTYSPFEWALLNLSIPYDSQLFFTINLIDEYKPISLPGKEIKYSFEQKEKDGLIVPKDLFIKSITIYNISVDSNLEIFEDVVVPRKELHNIKAFSLNPKNIHSAEVTIIAEGTSLYKCKDWNYTTQSCYGEWEYQFPITPGKPYTIHLNASDPGYAESIEVLNIYSYLKDGDIWTVNLNITGQADLNITPIGSTFTELLQDNNSTSNELLFNQLLCGNENITSNIYIIDSNSQEYKYSDLTPSDQIVVDHLSYKNFSCNDYLTHFTSTVLISGYATLNFSFGNLFALAYDPACVDLFDSATWPVGNVIVNMSGIYYINNDVTLCTDTYITDNDLIVINASSITLDCNGSILGGDNGSSDCGIEINGKNNVTVENCIIKNFGYGFYISGTENSTIKNNTVFSNINHGFYLISSSNYNNLTNNTAYDDDSGFFYDSSSYNTLADNIAHNNTHYGFLFSSADYNNFTNNTAYSNINHGFVFSDSDYNTLINNTAYGNSQFGFFISSSTHNTFIDNLAHHNTEYGFILFISANYNNLTNNTVYSNSNGFHIQTSTHNTFEDNLARNNIGSGFSIQSSNYTTLTDNIIYNNTRNGFHIMKASNYNTIIDTIFYNNAQSFGYYEIYFQNDTTGAPIGNTFQDTLIYDSIRYIGYTGYDITVLENNFTNLSICYNSSIGCVNWDFLNLTYTDLINGTNTVIAPDFISLDASDSGASQFNVSANLTIYSEYCSNLDYYKKTGFPTSRADILTGTAFTPVYSSCTGTTAIFSVDDFSGYTTGRGGITECTTIGAAGNYHLSNNLNAHDLTSSAVACINITAEDVSLNLNDYTIENGSEVYGIYVTANNTLIANGTINNFTITNDDAGGIVLGGSAGSTINNVTITDIDSTNEDSYCLYLASSHFTNITSNTISDCDVGVELNDATESNISFNNLTQCGVGFNIEIGHDNVIYNNTFTDSYESDLYMANDSYILNICWNNIYNNTGSGGLPIKYVNTSTELDNKEYSQLIVCGAVYANFTNINITGSTATDNNGVLIFYTNNSRFENINSSNNYYGIQMSAGSHYNSFENLTLKSNSDTALHVGSGSYCTANIPDCINEFNTFKNIIVTDSERAISFVLGNSNNITNASISDVENAFNFIASDDNILTDISMSNCSDAGEGTYCIQFDSYGVSSYESEDNLFYNINTYDSTHFFYYNTQFSVSNNFTNLSICNSQTLGCINWDFVNITNTNLINGTGENLILASDFVSLDASDSGASQFNKSANITIHSNYCSNPVYYKKTGFPTTKSAILTGTTFTPTYSSCTGTTAVFSADDAFSGYTTGSYCVNLSDSFTFGDKVVNMSGVYYINDDVTLCTDTYITDNDLIVINTSSITLDCNGSILDGDDGGTDYGIDITGKNNVTIENCIIKDFGRGIYLSGAENNIIKNNTVYSNRYSFYLCSSANYNTLTNNTAHADVQSGFYVYSSANYNTITNNLVYDEGFAGIYIRSSSYNNLTNNTVDDAGHGFYIYQSSNYNTLTNNTVHSSSEGFYLFDSSSYNVINNNTAYTNSKGFFISTSTNYNNITNNTIHSNTAYGLYISSANNNILTNNTVYANTNYAIRVALATGNLIFNNNFTDGGIAVVHDSGTNYWNTTQSTEAYSNIIGGRDIGGNYYSDYTDTDTDNDGIGEIVYNIPGGSNIDYLPLTNKVNYAPTAVNILLIDNQGNNSIIDTGTPDVEFNVTDPDNSTLSCEILFNNVGYGINSSTLNNTNTTITANTTVPSGDYNVTVECFDGASYINSTWNITISAVSSCTTLGSSGRYYLANDLNAHDLTSSADACINITANDVSLNLNNHKIENGSEIQGILVIGNDALIENGTINNFSVTAHPCGGIVFVNSMGSTANNVTIHNISSTNDDSGGIVFIDSMGCTANNVTIFNILSVNEDSHCIFMENSPATNITSSELYNCSLGFYVFNSSYTYIYNNIISNFDDENAIEGSDDVTVYNNTFSGSTFGLLFDDGGGSITDNNVSFNNFNGCMFGIWIKTGYDNIIYNNTFTDSLAVDIYMGNETYIPSVCWNSIYNNTGSGGLPIKYVNSSIELDNKEYSELLVCGAEYANFTNINISGSSGINNNGIFILYTNNSRFENIISSDNYYGINLLAGSWYNSFENIITISNEEENILLGSGSLCTESFDCAIQYNILTNLTVANSEAINMIYSFYNTITRAAISNSDYAISFIIATDNNISDITASNCSDSEDACIQFNDYGLGAGYEPIDNIFQNVTLHSSTYYLNYSGEYSDGWNYFQYLNICLDSSGKGCIKWDLVSSNYSNIINNTNIITDSEFVSLNSSDSNIEDFNSSANITVKVDSCTNPNNFVIYKDSSNLPTSKSYILSNGNPYTSTKSCDSSDSLKFGVTSFSGFAPKQTGVSSCRTISSPGTYQLIGDIDATSLHEIDNLACINITVSNVHLNLNGYTIANGTNISGIYAYGTAGSHLTNISIYNGTITNFTYDHTVNLYRAGIHFYYVDYSDINNITSSNITRTGVNGYPNGVYLERSDYNEITNNIFYKNYYGFYLRYSDYNNLTNNTAYTNSQYGFYSYLSTYNTFTNNTAHDNTNYGFYLWQSSNYNTLTNNIAYSNTHTGFYIRTSSIHNTLINNTANDNVDGFFIRQSSNYNTLTNNTAYDNTYGFHMYDSANYNTLTSNTVYDNTYGFYIYFSPSYNTLTNNLVHDNTDHGFYMYDSANYNNLTNNTVYGNAKNGIYIRKASNYNTIIDTTLYNNAQSANYYEIYFQNGSTGAPIGNTFYNTTIYNSTRYIGHTGYDITTSENNFTNFSICYNSSIGCANWDFLNISNATLVNGTNVIIAPDFISLNSSDSGASQFNKSANLTIYSDYCSDPYYYKKTGFPTTRASILTGTTFTPTYSSCTGTTAIFSADDFSGYTADTYTGCVNLSNPTTYQNKVVNMSGVYYINKNTTLCRDTYWINTTGFNSLLNLNASNIVFDCDYSIINGTGSNEQGIEVRFLENNTVKNCNIYDFDIGIRVWGGTNHTLSNNNITYSYLSARGFYIYNTNSNTFRNNNITDSFFSIYVDPSTNGLYCDNDIDTSNYGQDNKPIKYVHNTESVTIENLDGSEYSGIFFCDVNYSIIRNGIISHTQPWSDGIYLQLSSYNNITNITTYNVSYGAGMQGSQTTSHHNIIENSSFYDSYAAVFIGSYGDGPKGTAYTIVENNLIDGGFVGLIIHSSDNNTLVNNTISNMIYYGIDVYTAASYNNFTNITIRNVSTYGLFIKDHAQYSFNRFTNILLYNLSTFLKIEEEANLTNLTMCYNSTIGCINWDFINLTADVTLTNGTNIIIDPEFVSLNAGNAWQFSKPANITVKVDSCTNPNNFVIYKDSSNLPTSKSYILSNGNPYTSTKSCDSSTALKFNVSSFSGFAPRAPTPVTDCTTLSATGKYYLSKDIDASSLSSNAVACINITADDVSLNLNDYTIENGSEIYGILVTGDAASISDGAINNFTITNNDSLGIILFDSAGSTVHNVTITNVTSPNNDSYCVNANNSSATNITSSEFHDCNVGFLVLNSDGSYIYNNILSNSEENILEGSDDVTVYNNTFSGSTFGLSFDDDGGSITDNNVSFNNFNGCMLGILVDTGYDNIIYNNTFTDSLMIDIYMGNEGYFPSVCWVSIYNNTGSGGLPIKYVNSSTELDNKEYSELIVCGAKYANLTNINISGSSGINNNGIFILYTNNSRFENINSSDNYIGINIYAGSTYNTFENITVSSLPDAAICIGSEHSCTDDLPECLNEYNTFTDITAVDVETGIDIILSRYNTLTRAAISNTESAFSFTIATDNNISDITASNCSDSEDACIQFNDYGLGAGYEPIDNIFQNVTLHSSTYYLNYSGEYSDGWNYFQYLNICLDSSGKGCIKWDLVSSNYSNIINNTNIITDSEFVSLNSSDSNIEDFNSSANITVKVDSCTGSGDHTIYKLSGFPTTKSTILTSGTLYSPTSKSCDSSTSLKFGVTSFSGFAPSGEKISECRTISSPGTYQLAKDIDATSLHEIDNLACINITVSNVHLDLNGYTIANGTNISGIYANGTVGSHLTNISIYNGTITNFTYNHTAGLYRAGIHFDYVDYSNIENITSSYITRTGANGYPAGILLGYSEYNTITNNTVYNNNKHGLHLYSSSNYNILADNVVHDSTNDGFHLSFSDYNNITNNTVYSNTYYSFIFHFSDYNNIINNTAHSNAHHGFFITSATHNTFEDNLARNNTASGFYFFSSDYNNLTNNIIHNNSQHGIYMEGGVNYNTFINNKVYSNSQHGFYLSSNHNNTINFSSIYSNTQYGIYLTDSNDTTIENTNATSNTQGGIFIDSSSSGASLSNNKICFNTLGDIENYGTSNTGSLDRCDNFVGWNENGHLGCTYSCYDVWHLFFGNVSEQTVLGLKESEVMYNWSWQSSDGGKLYVANGDAAIGWDELEPLGRNTSSQPSSSDFEEADTVLSLTSFSDNINNTYSTDGSAPKYNTTMKLHERTLNNLSYVNSTNSSTFITAIVWDASDTIGDAEFDPTDNEDLVFVTNITSTTSGKYGDYNYEIRIPSTLDTYKGASGVVYFYLELT